MRTAAAAFVRGLKHHRPARDDVRRGVAGNLSFQRGEQVVEAGSGFQVLLGFAREFLVGVFLEPFAPVLGRNGEQLIEIDGVRRGDFALVLPFAVNGDGWPAGDLKPEAALAIFGRSAQRIERDGPGRISAVTGIEVGKDEAIRPAVRRTNLLERFPQVLAQFNPRLELLCLPIFNPAFAFLPLVVCGANLGCQLCQAFAVGAVGLRVSLFGFGFSFHSS